MISDALISIIIPTYNRADLIGETLDSILAQTYTNWEALIVDDGSTDKSDTVIHQYVKSDTRFKYFKRPASAAKGGNVCRNIGLEKAQGQFVVFFDSDDLMTADHLAVKIAPLAHNEHLDFTITKTEYFNKPDHKEDHVYELERFPITLENYLHQYINWLTLDICVRYHVIEGLRFNEKLKAGQEFNFYAKLLARTTNGQFVPKVVSLRRYHEGSIQSKLSSQMAKRESSFVSKWNTYIDLQGCMNKKEKKALLFNCIKSVIRLKGVPEAYTFPLLLETFKVFGGKGVYFLGYLLTKPFKKEYFFIQKLYRLDNSSGKFN
ncbi:MAG: glycosyltransferase family 2 protein [Marinirhabdus sp.]|nr:glycosyltransferase family 2 protein [Marinirhabdus sp.]